jgi:hypothetical protein
VNAISTPIEGLRQKSPIESKKSSTEEGDSTPNSRLSEDAIEMNKDLARKGAKPYKQTLPT